MTIMSVRHKIGDYQTWKAVFDESEELRRDYGLKACWILRDLVDASKLTVSCEIESVKRAREFMNLPAIKEMIRRAGVLDTPEISFSEVVAKVPALVGVSATSESETAGI